MYLKKTEMNLGDQRLPANRATTSQGGCRTDPKRIRAISGRFRWSSLANSCGRLRMWWVDHVFADELPG